LKYIDTWIKTELQVQEQTLSRTTTTQLEKRRLRSTYTEIWAQAAPNRDDSLATGGKSWCPSRALATLQGRGRNCSL